MMWVPEHDPAGRYRLLVVVPTGTRLYVLIEGPEPTKSPDAGPEDMSLTVETSTGEELTFWSVTRTTAHRKTKTVYLGQFDGPETVEPLRIRLQVNGDTVFAAVAVPVRAEPV